jgi:hypothetical protein
VSISSSKSLMPLESFNACAFSDSLTILPINVRFVSFLPVNDLTALSVVQPIERRMIGWVMNEEMWNEGNGKSLFHLKCLGEQDGQSILR